MATEQTVVINDDVSCVLCGAAGQGIQTIEKILPRVLKRWGYNVYATKEYMSRVRGGSNSTEIRISSGRVMSYLDRIDILIPLDSEAISHLGGRIGPETIIIGDRERIRPGRNIIDVPFSRIAKDVGSPLYENIVAVGMLSGIFGVDRPIVEEEIKKAFIRKSEEVVEGNIEAFRRGHATGMDFCRAGRFCVKIRRNEGVTGDLLLSGSEAVGLGAIAGGCSFISAYPMTPSTGVFTYLARHADDFGIIAEQAEDEIAAMNMQLGAWYAGARAMVTTSGGGFALMTEAVSLAGMIESPAVIYLAQRPGPATGLPTRTEQGDLEMALYAGHGEFPRVIYAPGTLEDAFYLTRRAFNVADRYQVPVFILSDQHLADSVYNIPALDLDGLVVEKHFVETGRGYRRYEITDSGLSPRGIPGHGSGLVCVDSDEHDEEGHITEDLDLRVKMVDKRLRKMDLIRQDAVPPELIGMDGYRTLVMGWGSTYGAIRDALGMLNRDDVAFLHVKQLWPLHPDVAGHMRRAEKTILVENNATAQFGRILRMHAGIDVDATILKYNGMPFSVEDIAGGIEREAEY